MRLYPNRQQWITIWLTTFVIVAAIGARERRAAIAYLIVGAVRAWSQAKSPARPWTSVAVGTVVTIVVLLAAMVLVHPKPACQ